MGQPPDNSQSRVSRLFHRRWFWLLINLVLILALIIILLPYGISYGVQRWLVAHGASQADVQHVEFNPFTGRMSLEQIQATVGDNRVLNLADTSLDLHWLPLWNKRINLSHLTISGATIDVQELPDGRWQVAGLTLPTTKSGWGLGVKQLQVENGEIHYIGPKLDTTVTLTQGKLIDFATWEPNRPSELELNAELGGGQLQLKAQALPLADTPGIQGHVELNGLSLRSLKPLLGNQITELTGQVGLNVTVHAKRQKDGSLVASQDGTVTLQQFQASNSHGSLSDDRIAWTGNVNMTVPRRRGGPRISGKGTLESTKLTASMPDRELQVANQGAQWKGELGYGQEDVPTGYEINGNLNLNDLRVNDTANGLELLRLQDMTLSGIQTKGTHDVVLADVHVKQLRAGQASASQGANDSLPPILQAARVDAHDVRATDLREWMIDSVQLRDAAASVQREKDGHWYLLPELFKKRGAGDPVQPGLPPRSIRIASLTVSGDSNLHFKDQSVTPIYETTLKLKKVEISRLDSTEPKKPSPFTVDADIGNYSSISLSGKLEPFAPGLSMDVTGEVHRLDLPPLSSYTVPELGYDITSGHLDGSIQLKVDEGEMNGVSHLDFSDLEVSAANEAQAKKLKSQLNMPLGAALDLLRNDNNDIKITVPVSGNLNAPDFHFGNVIDQALGSAIQLAAVDYVKYALQPYGAIILLAQLAHQEITEVRLTPVIFAPGSTALDSTATEYMTRLGKLMKDRPHLRIKLCGQAAPSDRKALQKQTTATQPASGTSTTKQTQPPSISEQQLRDLAATRARAVERYLVDRYGISPDRLFICQPEIDNQTHAEPKVELKI